MTGFDQHQLQSIEANDLNQIILAVAGSGKTMTTIACVLRALNHPSITRQLNDNAKMKPMNPKHIRVASFTNIAADTFKYRLNSLTDGDASDVHVSTLDKFAIQIIQHVYPNVNITTEEYAVAQELYYNVDATKNTLQQRYDVFKHYYQSLATIKNMPAFKRDKNDEYVLYYENLLNDYLDHMLTYKEKDETFDLPLQLIYPFAIGTMYQYQFIPNIELFIIDEIQDTSEGQFNFLSFLRTQLPEMRFVGVGDVSQSMYRWNKARPERVSNFITDFDATVYTLPNNYRSHPKIIDYANTMLKNNIDNITDVRINAQSDPTTHDPSNQRLNYHRSIGHMLQDIEHKIEQDNVKPKDIAIISRYASPLGEISKYNSLGKISFPVNDARIKDNKTSFLEKKIRSLNSFYAEFDSQNPTFSDVKAFFDFLRKQYLLDYLFNDLDYYATLFDKNPTRASRELKKEIRRMLTPLRKELTQSIFNRNDKTAKDGVYLSTVHGVKGDEYKYIYYIPGTLSPSKVIDIDEGLTTNEKEMRWGRYSEEQNIHYVAITRAIDEFHIVDMETRFPDSLSEIEEQKNKKNGGRYNVDLDALMAPFHQDIEAARSISPWENDINKELNIKTFAGVSWM